VWGISAESSRAEFLHRCSMVMWLWDEQYSVDLMNGARVSPLPTHHPMIDVSMVLIE
jgi:hypothetical protein